MAMCKRCAIDLCCESEKKSRSGTIGSVSKIKLECPASQKDKSQKYSRQSKAKIKNG